MRIQKFPHRSLTVAAEAEAAGELTVPMTGQNKQKEDADTDAHTDRDTNTDTDTDKATHRCVRLCYCYFCRC